jgi:ABC-type uncharacterized transport system auxiliary subunit
MITDLIARDLTAAHAVAVVLQAPSALPADYELSAQIESLEERNDGQGCSAHLRLRVLLVRAPSRGARRAVLQEELWADEKCTSGDPASFAEAMSRAVQSVSAQLRSTIAPYLTEKPQMSTDDHG